MHVLLTILALGLLAPLWRVSHPHGRTRRRRCRHCATAHKRYSERDLTRAYRAGHDTGAAEGPTDETRRRWAREGFEVPR